MIGTVLGVRVQKRRAVPGQALLPRLLLSPEGIGAPVVFGHWLDGCSLSPAACVHGGARNDVSQVLKNCHDTNLPFFFFLETTQMFIFIYFLFLLGRIHCENYHSVIFIFITQ